jgi:hypothetical protein
VPLLLHPHVIDVLNATDELLAGQDHWDLFEQALAQMAETHAWQRERYGHFRQGQKRTAAIEQLGASVEQAFEDRGEALETLLGQVSQRDLEVVASAARQLQKASQRIAKGSEEIEAEDTRQRLAPLPLLHDFLQAGFNVYGGYEPYSAILARLRPVVAWVGDLEQDWAGECELFESLRERDPAFSEAIELFKSGVGAVVVYEESGDERDLLAGLVQVQEATQKLAAFVSQARQDGADLASYSNFREIERWAVRLARLGAEDELVKAAREQVLDLFERQRQQLQDMADIPFDSEDYAQELAQAEAAWSRQQQALEEQDAEALGEASMAFQHSLERMAAALAEGSAELEEAPALQEIRKAVLGVYYHQVPRRFLADLLANIVPGFEQAYEVETEEDARQALELCLQAFQSAYLGLRDGSLEALADSLRCLNEGGPLLLAVQRRRVAEAEAAEESRKVTCTVCGHRQDPAPVCGKCGAKLLRPVGELGSSSLDLRDETDEKDATPQALLDLHHLVARLREGEVEEHEVLAVLDPIRARAKTVLAQATRAGAAEEFLASVQQFSFGLELLSDQARGRDLEKLEEGAELVEEAGQAILGFSP